MIVVDEASLVLPDGELDGAALVIEGGRVEEIVPPGAPRPRGERLKLPGCRLLPGFVDIHVHGLAGADVMDEAEGIARVAARLPRHGVTAFCPTTIACDPGRLDRVLAAVAAARAAPAPASARVLPAHLESNFLNPDYRGAQPLACLRTPIETGAGPAEACGGAAAGRFSGAEILRVIEARREAVAIVTMAPEIDGGLDLVRALARAGHLVSLGHSGADYEQARAALAAGARHATHLFNRMPPLHHRAPGLAAAVLEAPGVTAEIICDGHHVHPAMVRLALAIKPRGLVAITDGTAGAGLPAGSHARLGDQTIVVTERGALLEDGTLAGSVCTMDAAFRMLVTQVGLSIVEAARLCAAAPAELLGLPGHGGIAAGAPADLVALDADLRVRQTFVAGRPCLEP